jgi:hypothetical protein
MIFVNKYILLLQPIALDDKIKQNALLFNHFSNSILFFGGIVCQHYCTHFKTFCRVRKCWGWPWAYSKFIHENKEWKTVKISTEDQLTRIEKKWGIAFKAISVKFPESTDCSSNSFHDVS